MRVKKLSDRGKRVSNTHFLTRKVWFKQVFVVFLVLRSYYANETVLFSFLKQSHVTYGMCALLTKAS